MSEDWWSRRDRRRRLFDVNDIFRDFEDFMKKEFTEFFRNAPESVIRESKRPNGRPQVWEGEPFVYGYSVTRGL